MTEHERNNVLPKTRRGALLSSISETCRFLTVPMLALGTAMLMVFLVSHAVPLALPLGLLSGAAMLLATAIGTGYAASGYRQIENERNAILNGKSTARYLVQELDACRADGKSWADVIRSPNEEVQSLYKKTDSSADFPCL